nr:uncharacterized protein LOC123493632 [Aegilops tauschii subsp. strangulata]
MAACPASRAPWPRRPVDVPRAAPLAMASPSRPRVQALPRELARPRPPPARMAGIVHKEFPELAQTGLNYLSWSSNCEIFLQGKTLLRAIGKGAQLAVTDPKFETENAQCFWPWTALKQRFERLKYTVKPRAEAEWIRLRFADFKTVGEYNSALHQICTTLRLCGTKITDSQKIEKTLSTFHPDAVQSSRNYRQGNYTRYSELIDVLQVAEAQDEVLKKNFVAQPLGGSSRQEVNALKVRKPQQKKRGRKGKKKGPHPPPRPG